MSMPLYKNGIKASWKLLLILAAVLTMYISIIVAMFNPQLGAALGQLAVAMPQLMAMFGMNKAAASLVGFMASYLYGFIMLVFPMVFSILTANKLLAKQVEHGSMAFLLAAPVARSKIAFTQMKVLGSGIFALVAYSTAVGLVSAKVLFPGALDVNKFLQINLGLLCLQLFIGGICFLASCFFNETKYSSGFGAGIPALAFIVQMLANAGQKMENAKYATFFTLFNPNGIIAGESSAYFGIALLALGAFALYALGIAVFVKKDIPV